MRTSSLLLLLLLLAVGPPAWSAAAQTPTFVDVTTDLGANNPSVQFIDGERYFNFARGDAGWVSAFETAEARRLKRIYFPSGQYFFGGSSNASCAPVDIEPTNGLCYSPVVVDAALYPFLGQGVELRRCANQLRRPADDRGERRVCGRQARNRELVDEEHCQVL